MRSRDARPTFDSLLSGLTRSWRRGAAGQARRLSSTVKADQSFHYLQSISGVRRCGTGFRPCGNRSCRRGDSCLPCDHTRVRIRANGARIRRARIDVVRRCRTRRAAPGRREAWLRRRLHAWQPLASAGLRGSTCPPMLPPRSRSIPAGHPPHRSAVPFQRPAWDRRETDSVRFMHRAT